MLCIQTAPLKKKVRKSFLADLFLTYSKDTRIWRKYHICTNQINTKRSVKWIECVFCSWIQLSLSFFGGTLLLARLSTSLDFCQGILWFWSSLWRQCLVCPLLSKQKIKKNRTHYIKIMNVAHLWNREKFTWSWLLQLPFCDVWNVSVSLTR